MIVRPIIIKIVMNVENNNIFFYNYTTKNLIFINSFLNNTN